MALIELSEVRSNSSVHTDDDIDFNLFHVYSGDDQVGSVKDVLVDEQEGRFRYLIVDTGFWVFGKNVLLPIGLARFDYNNHRVYVNGLTQDQVEHLPEFSEELQIDQDYEERVRGIYRPMLSTQVLSGATPTSSSYNSDTYAYHQDPGLYEGSVPDERLFMYQRRMFGRDTY